MKKMSALILALALCAAPAFAEAAPQPSPEVAFAPTDSTILVACFSPRGVNVRAKSSIPSAASSASACRQRIKSISPPRQADRRPAVP